MKTDLKLEVYNHSDKQVHRFLEKISKINLDRSHYLLLFVGKYKSGKKSMLNKLQKKVGGFAEIDLQNVITQNEEESYGNIDTVFSSIPSSTKNILFKNGEVLTGQYTGYTYSTVRYATPQEKYLLGKIKGSEKFYVLELKEAEAIDKTLERFAQSAITFEAPASFIGKLIWKLTQIKINGHTFPSKRPTSSAI
tara:strand:+ start:18134 stop:18715 length:582 start_codon:yes stop_codon:yes gene_type:complete